ncbi:MAG TPA: agmatinase family protein [Solirubrobacteraceae bacterium]|nr:agmatinase family protein [Solirubrobacteraceae bacterium]
MTEPPQTADQTMWDSVLHAGLAGSFLRLPHVPPEAEALRARGARAAIYGIPWDSMAVGRSGASYGPRGIREISSTQFLTYNATWDFDLVEALAPVDCGDAHIIPGNPERSFEIAQAAISQIVAAGAVPVTLGGDHSVTIPAVRAVAEHSSDAGLILIDTHLDTALDVGGETLSNCCPITRAIEAGFAPSRTVLVGISGWMNPRTELAYCREHGITVIWLEDIWEAGVAAALERALAIAGGGDGIYLTVDVDSLDAAYGAGTSVPTAAGLTARELLELVRGIGRSGLVGLDVVETAPSLEATSATAGMATRVVMDGLAAHAGALGRA